MCADWYVPSIVYGYSFDISSFSSYRTAEHTLSSLRPFLSSPFDIHGILTKFHSRMEFETHFHDLDPFAFLVIGFIPDSDLQKTLTLSQELSEYIQHNPIFLGLDMDSTPRFFTGIPWPPASYDSSSISSDSSSDCYLSDEDDSLNYFDEVDEESEEEQEEEEVEEVEEVEERNAEEQNRFDSE